MGNNADITAGSKLKTTQLTCHVYQQMQNNNIKIVYKAYKTAKCFEAKESSSGSYKFKRAQASIHQCW
jgi:hypothetical protein